MAYELADRQKAYEDAYDEKIIRRIPVIIRVDGRGFSRVTRKLPRPYCHKLMALMSKTMLESIKEIDGAVFGYQQSDEISFVLRNDYSFESEPWFGNRIQKIASISASIVTSIFLKLLSEMTEQPKLIGLICFDARVFAVPSITEVVNNLLFRQQDCLRNSLTNAARTELTKKSGKKTADQILKGMGWKEREEVLSKECGINFSEKYPAAFRNGIGAYKIPKIIETDSGEQLTRQRWVLDFNLPKFNENREFIVSIIDSGRDIFRPERDIEEGVS